MNTIRLWFRLALAPRLTRFFLFPFKPLLCLLFGHRPMLMDGEYVGWNWTPSGPHQGRVNGSLRELPGVRFLACFRCRGVWAEPGVVLLQPLPGTRTERRKAEREGRK